MVELENTDFLSMSRRTFLKVLGAIGASAFIGTYHSDISKALELSKTKIVWIHGAECTGCSESLVNAGNPDLVQAIQKLNVDVVYHETFLAQQGLFVDGQHVGTSELNSEILLDDAIEEGDYILVVEGAVANGPEGSGRYCMYGERTFKEIFEHAAENATLIMAVGMCATYGGVNSADSEIAELTDFRGVDFLKEDRSKGMLTELGINKPVINIPGCPSHPDWILLTLAAVILGKIDINDLDPVLDSYKRPLVFFPEGNTMHDNCPRRGYYDRGVLDEDFGGEGCLLKLGCKGPYTRSDCALRKWNGSVSMCTQAGSSCIACCEPGFPDCATPFYEMNEDKPLFYGMNIGTLSTIGAAAAGVGIAAHAAKRIIFDKDEEEQEDRQ